MAQKIIIPKGTVNPGETIVIDVPEIMRGTSVVVAKMKSKTSTPVHPGKQSCNFKAARPGERTPSPIAHRQRPQSSNATPPSLFSISGGSQPGGSGSYDNYWGSSSGSKNFTSSGEYAGSSGSPAASCFNDNSGGYVNFGDDSGGYVNFDDLSLPDTSGITDASVQMRDLDRVDVAEENRLTDSLRHFQHSRRRLVKDLSDISRANPTHSTHLPSNKDCRL